MNLPYITAIWEWATKKSYLLEDYFREQLNK
jgi:hypothetical protein